MAESYWLCINGLCPGRRTGNAMTTSAVMITDMAILVGIFLLGLLAKLFPRKAVDREQRSETRDRN